MSALQDRTFRRLALAWTFSNFGDSTLYLTLPVWVKDLTGSDAQAGLVFMFLGLPVLLAPLAGQLADRGSRRRLVIVANLVGAVGVMALGLVDGRPDVWMVHAVTFGYGLITYVTSSAAAGLVRDILPDEQLASGNGLLSTIDQGLRLLSPLVGVGVYAAFGGWAIAAVTAGMLVLAAITTATLRIVESEPERDDLGFWRSVSAGAQHIRSVPALRSLTLVIAVAIGILGIVNTVVFAVIDEGLDRTADFFGVLAAIQGAASVVGGLTAARLIGKIGERRSAAIGLLLFACTLVLAATAVLPLVCLAMVTAGVGVPWTFVAFATLRQRLTPDRLQGRVSAAANMAINAPQTVGTALGAVLVAAVDFRILLAAMALVIAVCGARALATPGRTEAPVEPTPVAP